MTDKADGKQPVWPFVLLALATLVAGYPIVVALQLLSKPWSDLPEILSRTAIVLSGVANVRWCTRQSRISNK